MTETALLRFIGGPLSRASVAAALVLSLLAVAPAGAEEKSDRWFADGPITWDENDDRPFTPAPRPSQVQSWDTALLLRDDVAGEAERLLALEGKRPAKDVNALDEVPCSTWFCPRNHRQVLTPQEVAAGPPVPEPALPLIIVKGKDEGATAGFEVEDAEGRRFLLKLDPKGHLGLSTGSEMIGQRIFHAAGYNVPGARLVTLRPGIDLLLGEKATFKLYGVQKRPLSPDKVETLLAKTARRPDGGLQGVLVPWLPGTILGGFDMIGRRPDDPNDRIPHQDRRSLRASWALFAWLAVLDPGAINTLDVYGAAPDEKHVRHFFIDFGAGFGSASSHVKGPDRGGAYLVEVGRTLAAAASLGAYRRDFQDSRAQWSQAITEHPSLGFYPAETFDPDTYRTNRKVPSHMRRTEADLYWGAKLVTSFTDLQLAAIVAEAGLPEPEAAALLHALRIRRDIIGKRYLRPLTAIENPTVEGHSRGVCFDDLVLARGYAQPEATRYAVVVSDGLGHRLGLGTETPPPDGARICVPARADRPEPSGYRLVEVTAHYGDGADPRVAKAKPARIHLRWRSPERRFVVVGLEHGPHQILDGRPSIDDDPDLLFVPRALLTVPRVASRTVFLPLVQAGQVVESYQLFEWATAILTSDDGRIGLRPELHYRSGFLPTAGARFFYHPQAAPQATFITSAHTAGADAYTASTSLFTGPPWGMGLRLSAGGRRDHLFAGIGPSTQSTLETQGRGLGRYAAQGFAGELTATRPVGGLLTVDLVGRLERRDYGADRVRGGTSIAQFYGAAPGLCPAQKACVDPNLVPGFEHGLRLFEIGATVALDRRNPERDGGGWGLAVESTFAEGLAGDPSRHLRVGGEGVWALGALDRLLLFRVRGTSARALGSEPVPFERLPSPSGSAGLRGFPEGRFRDQSAVVGSAEYRWFIAANLDASLFVDVGTVAGPRFEGLFHNRLFPSVGFGLRRYPRTNLHWQAEVEDGVQVAYAKEAGFRLLLSVAGF